MSEPRSVETNAVDIESAIELGLEQLGVTRESVIVEILEESSRGLLGLGARQARVRLTTAAPPHPMSEPTAPLTATEELAEFEIDDPVVETEAQEPDRASALSDFSSVSAKEMDDDAQVGLATLEELLSKMQIEAQITVYRAPTADGESGDPPWMLQIQGQDLGVLIGRRGETLAALQYVTRLIASRDLQRRANIVVDVEGYKARREQMLHRLAGRMAEQALQLDRTVTLEPMSPYERRIVHIALRDHDQVITESVGEGDHRKVTIIPRNH